MQMQPPVNWVVSNEDQIAADKVFLQADMDMDGFVSGLEIKDVFLQSGLPQNVLAHIWYLFDSLLFFLLIITFMRKTEINFYVFFRNHSQGSM